MFLRFLAAAAAIACLTAIPAKAEPPSVGSVVTGLENILYCTDPSSAMALANTLVAAETSDEWIQIYQQLEALGTCNGIDRIAVPAKVEGVEFIGQSNEPVLDTWVVHISDPSGNLPDIWLIYDEAPGVPRLFHPAGLHI